MKSSDLREKSVEDLRELEKTLARDLFQNRLKNFTNRLDDTSSIRKTRRDLARVITLLRERQGGFVHKKTTKSVPAASAAEAPKAKAKTKAADTGAAGASASEASAVPRASASGEPKAKTKKSSKQSEAK
jgi:large subunit ribosomal protein L29